MFTLQASASPSSSPSAPPAAAASSAGAARPRLLTALLVGWAILAASPAWSFIVILKDGEQITASKEYKRDGEMVIITLQNGTEASYPAADIDFEKTDRINKGRNLSNARLIDGGEAQQLDKSARFEDEEKTLADLVSEGSSRGGLALPEQALRERPAAEADALANLPKTSAGFVDLIRLRRDSLGDEALANEIQQYLRSQGTEDARVYRGTSEGRPLLEINTASEASVFKALRDVANCLVQVRGRFDQLEAFDVLLLSGPRLRAGQFSLTPELANELVTGGLEPPEFFLSYVEF
ncbi:MAG: hypothetical protein AAF725_22370 [Acidobacteriota bacterium]